MCSRLRLSWYSLGCVPLYCACLLGLQPVHAAPLRDTTLDLRAARYTSRLHWNSHRISGILRTDQPGDMVGHVDFDSSVRSELAVYHGMVDLRECYFRNWAEFSAVVFDTNVSFENSVFKKCCFSSASISREVCFRNVRFDSIAYFDDLKLTPLSRLNFSGARLPETLNFNDNRSLPVEIDLTTANYSDPGRKTATGEYRKHKIFLYKSDCRNLHLNYEFFELVFEDPFRHVEVPEDERSAIYEELLKNFKDRGQGKSYELLDLEYQHYKWSKSDLHWLGWLPRIWWNYGYRKEYIFLWIAGLLFVFTSINFFLIEYLNNVVYRVLDPQLLLTAGGRRVGSLLRWWYSFIYTAAVFLKLTLKTENLRFEKWLSVIYILFVYSLGIICLAYLANFVIQKS